MSTQLDEITETVTQTVTQTGEAIHTHIIDRGNDNRSAEAIVLESRIIGMPITALCGYVWVPTRDPMKYPVCSKCLEIFEFAKDFRS